MKIILPIIVAISYFVLAKLIFFLGYTLDYPNVYGFPFAYKISGCYINEECVNNFIWSGLVLNIFWFGLMMFMAYEVGLLMNNKSRTGKIMVCVLFVFLQSIVSIFIGAPKAILNLAWQIFTQFRS